MKLISDNTKQICRDLKEALCIAAKGHKQLFIWSVVLWTVRGLFRLCMPIIGAAVVAEIQDNFDTKTMTAMLIFCIILNSSFGYFMDFLDFIFWDWLEPLRLFCHNHLFK